MALIDEYNDPKLYDCEYDIKYDLKIFCISHGNTALDMACGTGRIASELAKLGMHCTGIDCNEKMLAEAKRKNQNVEYILSDIRDFNLDKKFDLITMAANSFQALLTEEDQMNCLNSVANHLQDNGLFIMSTRNANNLKTIDNFEYWHDFIDYNGDFVQVYGKQLYNPTQNIMKYTTKRVWCRYEKISEISLKFTDYYRLLNLLQKCNLHVDIVYGGYNKEPFDPVVSQEIILICKKKYEKCF